MTPSGIEGRFDASFVTRLALREKQVQQSYRPIIGIHKWFARRPGTLFRALLLAEFDSAPLSDGFWAPHQLRGVIGDPFMGGGTPLYEANRLGFHVVGGDINPMAHWIVRQSLGALDLGAFAAAGAQVVREVEAELYPLYRTACLGCGDAADVKYFLWVKTARCTRCEVDNDLFPGHRLAEAERHPRHVLVCAGCGALGEYETPPTRAAPAPCAACGHAVHLEGNVARKRLHCRGCAAPMSVARFTAPPAHRLWAIEYHCARCYEGVDGRQFKAPDAADHARVAAAEDRWRARGDQLPIPDDEIPAGDETDRLHRWGYRRYRELFGTRQLLGLGTLLARIQAVPDPPVRHALLTVFSDTLRYQNLLCRYDTYALKCQDIFSVHGFPVGLVACENNLLGIAGVGSGSFRHFIEKYRRAKEYCAAPFETRQVGARKRQVPIAGETIEASMVDHFPRGSAAKQAYLVNAPSQATALPPGSLDGVFTDPPYFDNVQYAELIDFCFAWLRQGLAHEAGFVQRSTRSASELTGNDTLGRGLEHFAAGMSSVFRHFAAALKPGAPFVFTYHHNDPAAYAPLVVAILDAGLDCTATLPAAAEMSASLHIAGTGSSILDSVFVCRPRDKGALAAPPAVHLDPPAECRAVLAADAASMRAAGVELTRGDLRCLLAGHLARIAIRELHAGWDAAAPIATRLSAARARLAALAEDVGAAVAFEQESAAPLTPR